MKRQIFTLCIILTLAVGTVLLAQSANTQLPPSQQVDQSGQPEQSGRPDVDVDVGKNADNGVLNVDVKRHGDSDTKAGNNPNGNQGLVATGTAGSDPLHPNRTAQDQAYLSSGVLLTNSTGTSNATITRGGVVSGSSQVSSQVPDTTSPRGQDPLHPNRTTRDLAYLGSGTQLATNATTGSTTTTGSTAGSTYDNSSSSTSNTNVSGSSSTRPLPRTASDLPLVGLLGALSLAGALGLRRLR